MARKIVENESAISRPWEADGTGGQRIAIDIRRRGAARSLAGIRRINERASVSVQGRRSDTLAHDRFRVFGYQRSQFNGSKFENRMYFLATSRLAKRSCNFGRKRYRTYPIYFL